MFYPVFEGEVKNDNLILAIFEFDTNDLQYIAAPVSGYGDDEFVESNEVKIDSYFGDFNSWGEYYLEDSIKCNTLNKAQIMLIKWILQ